ncbi:bifunctional phosphopantothenoylcysteine decarboxylase/phosphopantothenate--cysteine ligase CoaBC [Corynebacterium sp. zg-331]|uniref:bifunctional phosphopantothenoylcysteine decarboxylase/phosphopantothenate--cysteine ligase CoaBC n=1 Tax=unclassified Corynebacterium TaxID=2624378 RepID=UPI00128D2E03|nr:MULTISPECIES: bifunctional phosphopantothenoylcysteine decarboxylase/phosphopantothenate--cysteine ligase CoaBC [unclassified Corynebacterium]MBC3185486.1 bifunctional phosphopantothenoylcysteine decarboxylase/phosphopantothenate--cysteine ligase CoaBC [Corynebacterium sp. zg-331]MPV51980.1 bifunctional phosphopantothenoylcysteine decarboxylase/phosphopantothenate--cysteine ligase CoaBC [Corynebacterium sp. zg331]
MKIIVGVAGGIAAYKACHLIRSFKESGDEVHVIPTPAALNFVGAATFEALSGNSVSTSVFEGVDEVRHVRLGQEAHGVIIAPATADLLARLAAGRADDLLSATILVAACPVIVAPAMHTEMWLHPATQANVEVLRARGVTVLEPASGRLTGTDSGTGRLLEPEQIADLARMVIAGTSLPRDLEGKRVLITAGGTQENLDPVRYLGNRSSGRQGFALAEVAAQRGARVHLIAGATEDMPVPAGARVERVVSATEMAAAVTEQALEADAIVMAAAVADFRPATQAGTKMKKGSDDGALATLNLVENPDILHGVVQARRRGEIPTHTVIAGFAAETGDGAYSALEYGLRKLERKGCDLLMCNEVGVGKVFGERRNRGWLLRARGEQPPEVIELDDSTKHQIAGAYLDAVVRFPSLQE